MKEHLFTRPDILASKLAAHVADILRRRIEQTGKALLLVSGGSTPVSFFKYLSVETLPWQHVMVSLADERWVKADHHDSNERLLRENLLVNKAAAAQYLSLVSEHDSPIDGEAEINERIRGLIEDDGLRIDVLILGMGEDGHTASLFPDADQLQQALDLTTTKYCKAITRQDLAHPRLTLTAAFLLSADHLVLHIEGDKKLAVLHKALAVESEHAPLPIAVILNAYGRAVKSSSIDKKLVATSKFPGAKVDGEVVLFYSPSH